MTKNSVRVLIADDSEAFRLMLSAALQSDPEITVVGQATNGNEAVSRALALNPDVVTMDAVMSGIDGIEAARRILAERPIPILLFTQLARSGEQHMGLNALILGVVDVVSKPRLLVGPEMAQESDAVIRLVKAAAKVNVAATPGRARRYETSTAGGPPEIVAIAASTGGPAALVKILSALADAMPPIVIAQHLAPELARSFAGWLRGVVDRDVVTVGAQGTQTPLQPNRLYLSGDGKNLRVVDRTHVIIEEPQPGQMSPNADLLFSSVAKAFKRRAVGVVLTGMGRDGAVGLKELRDGGAWTMVQNRESCVVYGMPEAAVEANACCESLHLSLIAPRLNDFFLGAAIGGSCGTPTR